MTSNVTLQTARLLSGLMGFFLGQVYKQNLKKQKNRQKSRASSSFQCLATYTGKIESLFSPDL